MTKIKLNNETLNQDKKNPGKGNILAVWKNKPGILKRKWSPTEWQVRPF